MARTSVADYLPEFLGRGNEPAYLQRQGYRTVRSSYREVAEAAFRFSRELRARKIQKGDRVVIWGPNSAEWVAAFFGCAFSGRDRGPDGRCRFAGFCRARDSAIGRESHSCFRATTQRRPRLQPI